MTRAKKVEMRFRVWVDIDGERFFGPGRAELLQLIEETGSISKAAKHMGMSYKKAWEMIDHMNANAHRPYVIAQKGGQRGGGTELTKTGKEVVRRYEKIMSKINRVIEKEKAFLKLV